MRALLAWAALTVICAAAALAQVAQQIQGDPAVMVASQQQDHAAQAKEWLLSGNPRLRAWGAYLALHIQSTDLVPNLLTLVSAYDGQAAADKDCHDAMIAVLDALIQLGANVRPKEAARIYADFPAQSLILLARSHLLEATRNWDEEMRGILLHMFETETKHQGAWLAAGNLLAGRSGFQPAPGFAAAVLEGMTLHAHVTVTTPGFGFGGGIGSASCGDGAPGGPKPGWPQVGSYAILNCGNQNVAPGDVVLADGADPAYYRRIVDGTYGSVLYSSCTCLVSRDAMREHYVSTLLHAPPDNPPLKAFIFRSITWQDEQAHASDLLGFIQQQQQKIALVLEDLQRRELLTADQAKAARPMLAVEIYDARSSKNPPLPEVTISSEKVTIKKASPYTAPVQ